MGTMILTVSSIWSSVNRTSYPFTHICMKFAVQYEVGQAISDNTRGIELYRSGKIPILGVELEPIHGGHNATSFLSDTVGVGYYRAT